MSGGTKTTTTTGTNSPYPAAKPNLDLAMRDARRLYTKGVGSQPYMGSTVIPYAQQTTAGMNELQNQAQANMGGQGLSGQAQNIIDNGGFNDPQMKAMKYLSGVADDPYDLSGSDTYQQYKSNQLDDISDRVNLATASAGRYGSGEHIGRSMRELQRAGTDMDMSQFARNDSLIGQLFNAGQTGMSNLSSAYQLGQMPAQSMMNVGGMYEDLATRLKNDELRKFDEMNNAPWDRLAKMMAVTSGSGQYGTSNTVAQEPGKSPIMQGLGGLGMLAGL